MMMHEAGSRGMWQVLCFTPYSADVRGNMPNNRKATVGKTRTTEQVFFDHLEKRQKGLEEEDIKQNYSPDVVQLTCMGIFRGHDGVREGNRILQDSLPAGRFEYYNTLVEGEMAFLEWRGFADGCEIKEGADSFLIRDGRIIVQTIHYKVHEK